MKMNDFVRRFVLVYDASEEPVVRPNELPISGTDLSGSEFEVAAPTFEEEFEKTRKKTCTVKSPLTAVAENWSLSILQNKSQFRSVANFLLFCR